MPIRTLCAVAALGLLLCACSETDSTGDGRKPYHYLLNEQFKASTFPAAVWTDIGPGIVSQDMAFGDPAPAMRLDGSGVQSGLTAGPFDATSKFAVRIAIDPAPGSGSSAAFVLRSGANVVASVTVEEGQITYVMGTTPPVTVAWATDGAFHLFEFEGANLSSGGHFWKRDGQLAASTTQPMGALQLTVSLEGPSAGSAWFDDVRVYQTLGYPH
ncbi:MAG: hypothetical protein KF696_10130 [Planctomycetes bacterium]|nr:hypothetical protein [Planctomycetota bacterium]MCW8136215.1 hypothetical protein [Planctomycetota bacterium]